MTYQLPDKPTDLIDLLDKRAFPLKSFAPGDTIEAVQRYSGARDVVDFLRSLQRDAFDRLTDNNQ